MHYHETLGLHRTQGQDMVLIGCCCRKASEHLHVFTRECNVAWEWEHSLQSKAWYPFPLVHNPELLWGLHLWSLQNCACFMSVLLHAVCSWPVMYTLARASAKTRSWGSQGAKDTARQEHGWSSNLITCTDWHHQKQKSILQWNFSVQTVVVPWLVYCLSVHQQIRIHDYWLAQ